MAPAVPARLTRAEGRKFGLTVGAAFAVLSGVLWWRGSDVAPYVGGLGATLVLGGLLVPGRLGPVYRVWMGAAQLLSKATTPILMGAIYFLAIAPIGLMMRVLGRTPIGRRSPKLAGWVPRTPRAQGSSGMERQF